AAGDEPDARAAQRLLLTLRRSRRRAARMFHDIQRMAGQSPDLIKETVMGEVRKHFRPAFVNRIDEIVVFQALDNAQIKEIAKIQLRRLEQRLASQEMKLEVSDAAIAEIAKVGFDPLYGARPLKRAIQQEIENPVAKLVLEGRFGPKDVIPVDFKNGKFAFDRIVHVTRQVSAAFTDEAGAVRITASQHPDAVGFFPTGTGPALLRSGTKIRRSWQGAAAMKLMSKTLGKLLVGFSAGLFAVAAQSAVIFTGSAGSRSASAEFDLTGTTLTVTLTNTSAADALVPIDILTALFFNVAGNPALTRTSATTGGNTFLGGALVSGAGTAVGGEWAYLNSLVGAPLGANSGISS